MIVFVKRSPNIVSGGMLGHPKHSRRDMFNESVTDYISIKCQHNWYHAFVKRNLCIVSNGTLRHFHYSRTDMLNECIIHDTLTECYRISCHTTAFIKRSISNIVCSGTLRCSELYHMEMWKYWKYKRVVPAR